MFLGHDRETHKHVCMKYELQSVETDTKICETMCEIDVKSATSIMIMDLSD